jgi:hypothetical protein
MSFSAQNRCFKAEMRTSTASLEHNHELRFRFVGERVLQNVCEPLLALWYPTRIVPAYDVFFVSYQFSNVRDGYALL